MMGKAEIGIYFCVTADILTKVLLKYFWSSPLPTVWVVSHSLILVGGHGNQKAKFSREKKKKNLLLRNHIAFIAVHSGERCGRWASGFLKVRGPDKNPGAAD